MPRLTLGIWAPAPQTIRPDPSVRSAFAALTEYGGGTDASYLYCADVVKKAEQIGFEICLIAQRYLGADLDSWVLATALATQTKKIKILAALHPGIADPRIAAKMGASIDRISGGRFCINIVNGLRRDEFAIYGKWLDQEKPRYWRMSEFISVMKGLWTQQDFSFQGKYYQIEHGKLPTKPIQNPYPPFYAASRIDDGMDVVARECSTWFVNYDKDRGNYAQSLKRIEFEIGIMEQRVKALGKTISYGINALVLIGESDEQAEEMAEEHLKFVASDPLCAVGTSGVGAALIGTPDTIAKRIRTYQSLGISLFMLHFYPMREGMEDFAKKVLPLVR